MKNYYKYIRIALMVIFAGIFLVSAIFLGDYFIKSRKQKQQHDKLASLVQQEQPSEDAISPTDDLKDFFEGDEEEEPPEVLDPNGPYIEVTHPVTGESINILREYATVFLMNSDMVGWLRIDGTRVNYPVMQKPDEINYYLKKDFYKEYSRHGSIYAHETASMKPVSDNITLYGHNMGDGSMFADLHKYTDEAFYKEHPYITFDTLYSHQTYKIFAVFPTTDWLDTGFAYHYFVDGDVDEFNEFVYQCRELSLYDTGETAVYGNKLLTLSTCDNDVTDEHGRFVIVAKKVSR